MFTREFSKVGFNVDGRYRCRSWCYLSRGFAAFNSSLGTWLGSRCGCRFFSRFSFIICAKNQALQF